MFFKFVLLVNISMEEGHVVLALGQQMLFWIKANLDDLIPALGPEENFVWLGLPVSLLLAVSWACAWRLFMTLPGQDGLFVLWPHVWKSKTFFGKMRVKETSSRRDHVSERAKLCQLCLSVLSNLFRDHGQTSCKQELLVALGSRRPPMTNVGTETAQRFLTGHIVLS